MNQVIKQLQPNKKDNITINLTQNGQEEEVLVIFIGKNKDVFNLNTTSHHKALHTQANTVVRGVLFDQSQANIDGVIKIDPGAQNTNAFLEQKILLVGDKSQAKATPQLEIEANEVKASHAATVSKLDEEQIFYLMSRGISREESIKELINGFFQPVIDKILNIKAKEELKKDLNIWQKYKKE